MATSGSQLTRIGAFFSGIAKKLTILAKTTVEIVSFGVSGSISTDGQGVTGAISTIGKGKRGLMFSTFAVSGTISTDGQGVTGAIDTSGTGVTTKFEG